MTLGKKNGFPSLQSLCGRSSISILQSEDSEIVFNHQYFEHRNMHQNGLTIKLALYCLVRLADEDGNDLKVEYPPLVSPVSRVEEGN